MSANPKTPQNKEPLRERFILLGFATLKERPNRSIEVSIRWGRVVAVLFALSMIGWLSVTGALYAYLKYTQGFKAVSFSNTLLLQRSELRRKIGDQQIQESIVHLNAGNYGDSFRLLHFGVARSPGNLEGRKLIADFYELARKRPPIAADYLLEGLSHGGLQDIEYLKKMIQVLLRNQMDEKIQELAETYLPEEPELTDTNKLLALGAAMANYHRENYDQAEDYLIAYNLLESIDGLLIYSKISWDQGDRIAAITKLEQMMGRFPDSDPLLLQLSNYYREIGDMDQARRYAILRSVKDPLNYKPRIELLYIYNNEGDIEREASEIERFFEQFSQDKSALIEFANLAAKTGNTDLSKRIQTVALDNGFDIDMFAILVLEAHIVSKDYVKALTLSESLIEQKPTWLTKRWAAFNSLRSIAAFAINRPDLGEIYLQNFLKGTAQMPQTYLSVSNHFSTIDRIPQARKVLSVAYQKFPKNQKILSELIAMDLELGKTERLDALLIKLLQMRRPQRELLAKAYQELGSDRFIFTKNRDLLLLQLSAILRENN